MQDKRFLRGGEFWHLNPANPDSFPGAKGTAWSALRVWFDLLDARRPGQPPIDRAKALAACELPEFNPTESDE